jgi:hypothetical protein
MADYMQKFRLPPPLVERGRILAAKEHNALSVILRRAVAIGIDALEADAARRDERHERVATS